ncbi:MAG: peptide chain release factor N(5)-glutamine methyltransferase [Erythrobacter sp.]|nr:peptide chain release factor N(5)-glutamine methyltransferase [Erythrobacter sp.]NCQ63571.1 peptide chain release factor N(5)-glutamine methyltransferase [Alphaproteobacteria bacterium]
MSEGGTVRGSVGEAIREAAETLAPASDSARIDAELLMAHALGLSRSDMLVRAMRDPAPVGFEALVARRFAHEPVAYITGSADFYGLDLQVSPAVLIPRGDSETLIDAARDHFAHREPPARILDLGTGSGALLLAALSHWPRAEGVGLDASLPALRIADCNARKLGMADRIRFVRRSWRKGNWQRDLGTFDLVLCNPPYVEDDAPLEPQVRDYEPACALFAGAQGLDDYRILIPRLGDLLTAEAVAIFEIGFTQQADVTALAQNEGYRCACRQDLAGRPRAMIMQQGVGKETGNR